MTNGQERGRKNWIALVGLLVTAAALAVGILNYRRVKTADELAEARLEADKRLILSASLENNSNLLRLSVQNPSDAALQQLKILWPDSLDLEPEVVEFPYNIDLSKAENRIVTYIARRFPLVETRSGKNFLPVVIGAVHTIRGDRRIRYGLYVLPYSYKVQMGESPDIDFVSLLFVKEIERGTDPKEVLEEAWSELQLQGI